MCSISLKNGYLYDIMDDHKNFNSFNIIKLFFIIVNLIMPKIYRNLP
jgi:hypothetical protein